jgi:cytochrome c peroxidase
MTRLPARVRIGGVVVLTAAAAAVFVAAPTFLFAFGNAAESATPIEFSPKERSIILQFSPLPPLPPDPTNSFADDPLAARLGHALFFDKGMSSNGQVACATCHDPSHSFTDGKPLAQGVGQSVRHSAALWNVAYNRWFFWDGRTDTLWAQALRPMETESELGASRLHIAHHIHDDANLRRMYEEVFGPLPPLSDTSRFPVSARPVVDNPTHPEQQAWAGMREDDQRLANRVFVNVGKSLAAYERQIVSGNSAFDAFAAALRDNDTIKMADYPVAAQRGLKLFIGKGNCRLCHSGPNFTDGEFHDTRLRTPDGAPPRDPGRYVGAAQVLGDPFNAKGAFSDDPTGAAAGKLDFLANSPQNWGLFKTPSLRNVAVTAPYMHLGQIATLPDVLRHYSTLKDAADSHHPERILIRLDLTEQEIDDLLAFLATLTDTSLDPRLLAAPRS